MRPLKRPRRLLLELMGLIMTNWKYTKGSEKDFDGAPDWCESIVKRKPNGTAYMLSSDYSAADIERCGDAIIAQREPITAWEGEGLPPVGVECEMLNKVNKRWYPVKICFIDGDNMAWIESNGGVIDCTGSAYLKEFRPIRSARDKAVEAISIIRDRDGYKIAACMCEPIYDAIAAGKIPHVKLED